MSPRDPRFCRLLHIGYFTWSHLLCSRSFLISLCKFSIFGITINIYLCLVLFNISETERIIVWYEQCRTKNRRSKLCISKVFIIISQYTALKTCLGDSRYVLCDSEPARCKSNTGHKCCSKSKWQWVKQIVPWNIYRQIALPNQVCELTDQQHLAVCIIYIIR